MLPEFTKLRRQDRLRNLDHLAHKSLRLWAKREIDPSFSAEQVRNDGKPAALHALEEQRRTTFGNHAAMDLGQLEVWIDLGFDGDDFVFSGKPIEKCAQAGVHSLAYGRSAGLSTVRGRARCVAAGSLRRFSISSC